MGNYETPDYDVIVREDDFEIREYIDFYIVEYDNEKDPDISNGFRTLFNYISSENEENEKIKMTVPVIEEVTKNKKKIAFVVPGKYGEQIPEPRSDYLKVRKFDRGIFGVIRYSGFSKEAKESVMKDRLYDWLEKMGYEKKSKCMLAFYNSPFVPPMFRRNEILVRVEKKR